MWPNYSVLVPGEICLWLISVLWRDLLKCSSIKPTIGNYSESCALWLHDSILLFPWFLLIQSNNASTLKAKNLTAIHNLQRPKYECHSEHPLLLETQVKMCSFSCDKCNVPIQTSSHPSLPDISISKVDSMMLWCCVKALTALQNISHSCLCWNAIKEVNSLLYRNAAWHSLFIPTGND